MFEESHEALSVISKVKVRAPVADLQGLVRWANASARFLAVIAEVYLYLVEFKHMPKIADKVVEALQLPKGLLNDKSN